MKGLGVHVVSYATWNELQAELRALRAERDGMLAERKDTLDLSRRRLDQSQAEIARLTELVEQYANDAGR